MQLYYALDLRDDPALIAEYERWHRPGTIWTEIPASIRAAGVRDLQIFRACNRLFMVLDVPDDFLPAAKAAADATDPRVQAWERLMDQFQQALSGAQRGEKWTPLRRIFSLQEALAYRDHDRSDRDRD